jgi:hypothetical protein
LGGSGSSMVSDFWNTWKWWGYAMDPTATRVLGPTTFVCFKYPVIRLNTVQLFVQPVRYLLAGGSSYVMKSFATEMPLWRYIACLKKFEMYVQSQEWDSSSFLLFSQSLKSVCIADSDFPAVHSFEFTCWKYSRSPKRNLYCSVLYLRVNTVAECLPVWRS